MHRLLLTLLALSLAGCETPTVERQLPTQTGDRIVTQDRSIDRLLLEAGRTEPPRSTELSVQAANMALRAGDTSLAMRIAATLQYPYATSQLARESTFLSVQLALLADEPREAVRLLDDARFQELQFTREEQIQIGRLRAEAYQLGRSFLASARELIYINNLIPFEERQANHEAIFSTLLSLDEATLRRQAEQSITSEIRGWLSLAAMTRRFQHDPLRQLNGLRDWQKVWSTHPAAITVPNSLTMLSRIVAERPQHVALLLPLSGPLASIGKAIRDGYIAAHYQLSPDTKLQVINSNSGDIKELTSRAVRNGAEIIIGPLERSKVTELAGMNLQVPVIALNRTLNNEINPDLYQFGLAPEDESEQVAGQVIQEDRQQALIIAPDTDWGRRNFDAFTERFTREGGVVVDYAFFSEQRDYSDLVKDLLNVDSSEQRAASLRQITGERFEFDARRRQDIDFVFLLSNSSQARGINPTLAFFYAEDIPVYSTSHVNVATDSRIEAIDLNGIRFCDIPWKLTDNDDIQRLIESTWPESGDNLASFYAMGVDVHRLYPRLQQLKEFPDERIFGSTGVLRLTADNVVTRTLMWAFFENGEVRSVPLIMKSS